MRERNKIYLIFRLASVLTLYLIVTKKVVVKLETFRKHVAAAADYDESKHHLKL